MRSRFNQRVPIKENSVFEGRFPDIKPPELTHTSTDWGDCVVMSGSESFTPVTILTTANANPTLAGQIIASIPINPTLLLGTRLAKISENYERWYPRQVILEYVPLGSALDPGSIISIPVLDPSDSFLGVTGNTAIRRALAYEQSYSFNIYDHPQITMPYVQNDQPYFVVAGDDARFEISHIWYLMAQSTFPPSGSETTRTLGWFKIHYIVEFYEPKIPLIVEPFSYSANITAGSLVAYFGSDTSVGDECILDVDLFNPDPTRSYYSILVTSNWRHNTSDEITVTDGNVTWNPRAGTIMYARLVVNVTPQYVLFSNYSDLFSNNNSLRWAETLVSSFTGGWSFTEIPSS